MILSQAATDNVMLGSTEVDRVYQGSVLVWQRQTVEYQFDPSDGITGTASWDDTSYTQLSHVQSYKITYNGDTIASQEWLKVSISNPSPNIVSIRNSENDPDRFQLEFSFLSINDSDEPRYVYATLTQAESGKTIQVTLVQEAKPQPSSVLIAAEIVDGIFSSTTDIYRDSDNLRLLELPNDGTSHILNVRGVSSVTANTNVDTGTQATIIFYIKAQTNLDYRAVSISKDAGFTEIGTPADINVPSSGDASIEISVSYQDGYQGKFAIRYGNDSNWYLFLLTITIDPFQR